MSCKVGNSRHTEDECRPKCSCPHWPSCTVRTSQKSHYVSATEPNRLMLFRETVAVYCENHTEHTDTVRTSQETHCVSATEPNRLMLFVETVAVYCENHTEHTDTVCTSHETHYVSATEPNRLMLFGETVAVYCENHTEHTDTVRTSEETHYFSTTEPNRLMLFGKQSLFTVRTIRSTQIQSVPHRNHTEHRYSPYLTGTIWNTDTVRTSQKHRYSVWAERGSYRYHETVTIW
jgi:hypothetical protein